MIHEGLLPHGVALAGGVCMASSGVCIVIQAWFSMMDNEARGWTHRPAYEWAPMMATGLALSARAVTIFWLGAGLSFLFLLVCVPMSLWQLAALVRSATHNLQRRKIAKLVKSSAPAPLRGPDNLRHSD